MKQRTIVLEGYAVFYGNGLCRMVRKHGRTEARRRYDQINKDRKIHGENRREHMRQILRYGIAVSEAHGLCHCPCHFMGAHMHCHWFCCQDVNHMFLDQNLRLNSLGSIRATEPCSREEQDDMEYMRLNILKFAKERGLQCWI